MALTPIDIVDAFTDRPFGGNPAAIIPDAVGLSDRQMLAITSELRMEAGFVLPAPEHRADLRLRFFTPRREAMLSGHVLAAAMISLADRGQLPGGAAPQSLRVETGRGVLAATFTPGGKAPARVTFDLPLPRFGEQVSVDEAATALGVPPAAVGVGESRPQRVSCGFDVLVVPLADRTVALGAITAMEPIRRLTDSLSVGGIVCFCPDTQTPGVDLLCRFFYPSEGTDEDIVSGTSLGAVAAYCLEHAIVAPAPHVRLVSAQGHSLGRPNRAIVEAEMTGRHISRVKLTATGAVVLRGELRVEAPAAVTSS